MSQVAWLNSGMLPYTSETARDVLTCSDCEVVVSGPTRTSKTLLCLHKLFYLHFKYPGFLSAVVRAYSVDLTETIRFDIRNTLLRFPLEDSLCPVKFRGGVTQFHTLYINGGEMRLGGMNRPGKIMGAEYDAVFYSQAEQSTLEQHQMLKTRVSGSAGNWVRDGKVQFQFLMDANPDAPDHYLRLREKRGLVRFINMNFEDNPLFFQNDDWTEQGKVVVDELDKSFVGVYHDRLFKGLWVAPENLVFRLKKKNILNQLPPSWKGYLIYNAIDFGLSSPSVCLWIAHKITDGSVIVFQEYRQTNTTILELGKAIRSLRGSRSVAGTVIDNDEEKRRLLVSHCGIPSELARKGQARSWMVFI